MDDIRKFSWTYQDMGYTIEGTFEYDEDIESGQRTIGLTRYTIYDDQDHDITDVVDESTKSYMLKQLWYIAEEV